MAVLEVSSPARSYERLRLFELASVSLVSRFRWSNAYDVTLDFGSVTLVT